MLTHLFYKILFVSAFLSLLGIAFSLWTGYSQHGNQRVWLPSDIFLWVSQGYDVDLADISELGSSGEQGEQSYQKIEQLPLSQRVKDQLHFISQVNTIKNSHLLEISEFLDSLD